MHDNNSESHKISNSGQRGLDLSGKNSVTAPSSLADSAISLSTTDESCSVMSYSGKNRPDDIFNESQRVIHESLPRSHTADAATGTVAKDKRKKIGLSRLLRGKQKDL